MILQYNKFIIIGILFICTGCSGIGSFAANAAAGALGNMIDRRIEDKLGNDAGLSDEKLDGKIKEKNNECEDCETDER
jgi:hypothetical protein